MSIKKAGVACSIPAIISIVIGMYGDKLEISKDGLQLIGNFESCRKDSYYCPAHVVTAGVGHTGSDVKIKRIYSDEQIAAWWANDILGTEKCVKENASHAMKQGQFDAYVSLAFNVGCGTFSRSSVVKYENNGQILKSCQSILLYDKANGRVLQGLKSRREKEYQLCTKK